MTAQLLGVSLRASRDTTQVMLGISLRARCDTTLVFLISTCILCEYTNIIYFKTNLMYNYPTQTKVMSFLMREVIHDAALLAALDKLLRFVVIRQCVYVHKTSCCIVVDNNCSLDAASSKHSVELLQRCLSTGGLSPL